MTTVTIASEISADYDPFFSESNMAQLKKADRQIRSGHIVERTMEELEALENEQDPVCGECVG